MPFLVTDPASDVAALARLFEIGYGREAGSNGLAFWGTAIEEGTATLTDVARAMTRTREFNDGFDADLSDRDFIATLYQQSFGREGQSGGLDFWAARLEAGLSRAEALAAFARSAEAQSAIDVLGEAGLTVGDFEAPAFRYGVASGDPQADSVVLWTHARPAGADGTVTVGWEVATDADFGQIVASGQTQTSAAQDYTVKVIPEGLEPGASYYYRFTTGDETSMTGQTRTLAETGLDALTLAIFSCSNFPAGFFNAYAEAAERGFDFSVHLGDYIYEYGADGFASGQAAALGRISRPASELLTAEDYSLRYAQYHSDADLQAVRAAAPMIMMWDDHETANDSYTAGAENHDPATEGDWLERRDKALDAYFNWNPVREPDGGDLADFDRAFDFGDLATLHMLETRLQARDQQIDYATGIGARIAAYQADPTGATFAADVAAFPQLVPAGLDAADPATLAALSQNPDFVQGLALATVLGDAEFSVRSMIGAEQLTEFGERVEASDAAWQIIGSQTLMNRMTLPAPILLDPATLPAYLTAVGKLNAGLELTAEEQALFDAPLIPYNLDAWDGYGAEREALLQVLIGNDANAVVIAGDTHNAWFGEILSRDGTTAAYEFGGPGVSSPGLEDFLSQVDPALVEQVFLGSVPTLSYANTADRGYMEMRVTRDAVTTDYVYVNAVDTIDYETEVVTQTVGADLFG